MIKFIGNHSLEVRDAILHSFPELADETGTTLSHLFVVAGATGISDDAARIALEGGHNVVIMNASKGQLAGVDPGTGIEVPSDLALFAVKRIPIAGHSRPHTIITMVANSEALGAESFSSNMDGKETPYQQPTPNMSLENSVQQLRLHVDSLLDLDSNLIPPSGTNYATMSYNMTYGWPVSQDWGWGTSTANSQNFLSITSATFYIYLANGDGEVTPQYVILMTQKGSVTPAANGQIENNGGACYFVLATTTMQYTVQIGALTPPLVSPGSTTSSPVVTSVEFPMTVIADVPGGTGSLAFTPTFGASNDNIGWGIAFQPSSDNEANWVYYNNSGWNALTQSVSNFSDWGPNMYNDDNLNGFDTQCLNGIDFSTAAIWTIPQNPQNAGPLNVQLYYRNTYRMDGFVNRGNSNCWKDQMGSLTGWCGQALTTWDLVALTTPSNNNASAGTSASPDVHI